MTITFKIEDGTPVVVPAEAGESLLDIAKRAGVVIDAPCGGYGTCQKCRVKLELGTLDSKQPETISDAEWADGWRLACQSKAKDDVVIFVPASASDYKSRIRVTDFSGPREKAALSKLRADMKELNFYGDYGISSVEVELSEPSLDDAMADRERMLWALSAVFGVPEGNISFSLSAMKNMPKVLRDNGFKATCIYRDTATGGKRIIDVQAPGRKQITGLAIDIGTTTVAMLLVNLENGRIRTAASAGNAQIRYGADVINRIIASTKKGGLDMLWRAIVEECMTPLINRLCVTVGIEPSDIYRVAIAGNTTMTHLAMGVSPEFLRLEPYVPAFYRAEKLLAGSIGIPVNPTAQVVIAPAVGSYVGGDITAGVLSAGFYRKEPLCLFIDLGTNGEIVFGNQDFMMCCACSAGPAFEGGEISCGMRATIGAIEAVTIKDSGEPVLSIIGEDTEDVKAAGLCGSGLIDIIGELFRCGIIDAKGKFNDGKPRVVCDDYGMKGYIVAYAAETESGHDMILTEGDIDNFIRAKGSIFSAIRTMLGNADTPIEAIERVYVAGGIGSGINIKNAIRIGMFPKIDEEKYLYIGNSSLMGAYAMLSSPAAVEAVHDKVASNMTYLELSSTPGYMDEFIAACFLPHTDAGLFE